MAVPGRTSGPVTMVSRSSDGRVHGGLQGPGPLILGRPWRVDALVARGVTAPACSTTASRSRRRRQGPTLRPAMPLLVGGPRRAHHTADGMRHGRHVCIARQPSAIAPEGYDVVTVLAVHRAPTARTGRILPPSVRASRPKAPADHPSPPPCAPGPIAWQSAGTPIRAGDLDPADHERFRPLHLGRESTEPRPLISNETCTVPRPALTRRPSPPPAGTCASRIFAGQVSRSSASGAGSCGGASASA